MSQTFLACLSNLGTPQRAGKGETCDRERTGDDFTDNSTHGKPALPAGQQVGGRFPPVATRRLQQMAQRAVADNTRNSGGKVSWALQRLFSRDAVLSSLKPRAVMGARQLPRRFLLFAAGGFFRVPSC